MRLPAGGQGPPIGSNAADSPGAEWAPGGPRPKPSGKAQEDSLAVLERASALGRSGRAFALLTVVRTEGFSSAKAGDKGIWAGNDQWWGWVGGSCAGPIARRHARAALEDGQCRLICITRDLETPTRAGVLLEPMSCFSGGTIEILIEPRIPAPQLVVFGDSPVATALRRLGEAMGYRLRSVDPQADAPRGSQQTAEAHGGGEGRQLWVVVASHGDGDAIALRWALSAGAQYVGLIASRRRHASLQEQLHKSGLDSTAVAQVRGPAGLDIGARRPDEVALSVLAECIALMRADKAPSEQAAGSAPGREASPPRAPRAATATEPSTRPSSAGQSSDHGPGEIHEPK